MPRKTSKRSSSNSSSSRGVPTQPSLLGFEESDKPEPKAETTTSSVKENPPSASRGPSALETHSLPDQVDHDRPDLKDKLVIVVDSHSLIYQVFHALPPMSSPSGLPVSAVHGFLGDMLELLTRKQPDFLLCAFDKSEVTFRNELFDEYKAHRDPMPDELRQQIPLIRHVIAAIGAAQLECAGYEADDILAKVAAEVEAGGGRCLVVTSDKDCRQLITDKVHLYNIRKQKEMGPQELMDDWGIRPDQVVDYQAMVGDPVDNVPGIPLVGPKLAKQLLDDYDTLEGVFENSDKISGPKRRQNVQNGQERASLSRELVRLRTDFECAIPWADARTGNADLTRVEMLCEEFGFRRLRDRASEVLGTSQVAAAQAPTIDRSKYMCIETEADLQDLVERLQSCELICVDCETTDTNPRKSELVGISVAWEIGQACYIPVRAPEGDATLPERTVIKALRPILEDSQIGKIGQNIKYDLVVLRGCGVEIAGIRHDTMVADYILEPGRRSHTLDDIAERYLQHSMISITELIGKGKHQKQMDEVPLQEVAEYAAEDADIPFRIAPMLRERLELEGLSRLYHDVEVPLVEVLAEMEFNGIYVDVEKLSELSQGFAEEISTLRDQIYELAGCEFNIDSPKQLAKVLFGDLGLPIIKRTKTGASTDADVLQQLSVDHDLPEKVVAYRQATKLKNTYVDALPTLVCEKTGRIHTSFRQDVAATGRLSSSEPNLQNIPVRNEQGKAIRSAFRAGHEGWLLLGADYSQIELRVLAHYSGDQALMQAYTDDADIHRRVAAEVHEVSEDEVTSDMRRMAKTINFGIVYGQSAFGLARTLRIGKDEAADYIEMYFERYPGVQQFMLDTLAHCRNTGSVSTMLGRRRPVQGVRDFAKLDPVKRRTLTEPERIAVNTVIQGSAADLIKLAMLNVYHRLREENLRATLLLQIHDELLFEVHPDDAASLESLVREEMSGVTELSVPLKVDVAIGTSWAEV